MNNTHIQYTLAWQLWSKGLWFISDYDLKPPRQIFLIDSNANLPFDNDFLYWFLWQLWLENEQLNWLFLTYTDGGGHIVYVIFAISASVFQVLFIILGSKQTIPS